MPPPTHHHPPPPPPKPFNIAIIGGGIAGLTLAIALQHRSIPYTIYEAAPRFGEIGAGVAFGPNAVRAMRACDSSVYAAYERVATHNLWREKRRVYFEWVDGFHGEESEGEGREGGTGYLPAKFRLENEEGANSVHRAHFLDELVRLIPEGVSRFGKRLVGVEGVEERGGGDGKLKLRFAGGTEEEADAVVGCDGIKSVVRRIIVGEDHPSARPQYSHKYAYRGLIPMDKAVEALGEERAGNACMYMGPNGHALTFPIDGGRTLNLVAFRTNEKDWPDYNRLVLPTSKAEALSEFEGWGKNVRTLMQMVKNEPDCWALFDLGDHPCPTYCKGRLCISGDAAHATTPHHGSGAGFAIEDSAVLAEILADERVQGLRDVEEAFAAFDASRRERTQWLVQSSRRTGDLFEWRAEGVGDDVRKIEEELRWRHERIWDEQISDMIREGKEELGRRLGAQAKI